MVPKKTRRSAKKDAGDTQPIAVIEHVEPVEEPVPPEPKLLSSEETAWKLLNDAPAVPEIYSIDQAVEFVDKYSRWMRDVQGTKR